MLLQYSLLDWENVVTRSTGRDVYSGRMTHHMTSDVTSDVTRDVTRDVIFSYSL